MCMVENADGPWEFYEQREVKAARRQHCCAECLRTIRIGESYHYAKGFYDSRFQTFHTCAHCRVAQVWLERECGGFLHDGVLEDIQNHVEEGVHGLGRLYVGMRRKWKRFKSDELLPVPGGPA